MRNPRELDWLIESDGKTSREAKYKTTATFGHDVGTELKEAVYSVTFTAAGGEWKLMQAKTATKLTAPRGGSFEERLAKTGHEFAFLDLNHHPADVWYRKLRTAMRPMGYQWMEGDWSKCFDGVIYAKTMAGSEMIEMEEKEPK